MRGKQVVHRARWGAGGGTMILRTILSDRSPGGLGIEQRGGHQFDMRQTWV